MDNKPAPSVEETMYKSGIPKDMMTASHTEDATEEQGRVIPEDTVKDAMTVKDSTEGEGILAFVDVRKNAMSTKVVSEGAQSQPSSGRSEKIGLHLFFMNIRWLLQLVSREKICDSE